MNLKELNSFKLSDAVTFHDKLNPKLWNGTKLRPDVREQLLVIAQDFLQELGVHDLDVKDITISGSNAAYSYTKHSDLDLHILVDMGNLPVDEVYRELFTAKKTIYNDTHDIKINTIPVELYVQDSREPVVSLGEYSVMNDQWIRIPTKRRSDFDQTATKSKYEKLLSLIEIALQSKKYSKVKHIIDTIKRYRQAGLDKGGEFGPENLAYKMLRSQGYITKLYDLRDKLHSEKLSFETMYRNVTDEDYDPNGIPPGPEFKPTMPKGTVRVDVSDVYDWYKLGQYISNLDRADPKMFGKGPPSTIMAFGSEPEEHNYINALKKLGLDTTDIDPVDPNQPKNTPRQKVDPTYNVNETTEQEIHNYSKLDNILEKLCDMVVKGQQKDSEYYGMVAAAVLDPDNNIVAGVNRFASDNKRVHAERVAIEKYENKYGTVPEGSIVITTLSPCSESDDETAMGRVGESCTDYLNSKGIEKVYCGYMDPTQDNFNREFNIMETSNKAIRHKCKQFADTFLKKEINEELEQIPSVLYHATYKQRLKSIKLNGLGAGGKRNWTDSKRGVVYLALDPHVAESYAETALDDLDADWDIVILQVSTTGLDPNKFHLDSNVQDNEGHTVEYHGIIPPSNISLYKSGVTEEYNTMQYASEKTPPVSPYAGVKDNQYRGGISEAVSDNYLYHSIESMDTFRKIINTGEIKPKTPIEYEENDIEMPVISASRNQYYRFPYGGGNIQFVIDKDALKQSGFKVKPYSYSQHYGTKQDAPAGNELHKQETEEQIFPFKGHGIPVKQPYIMGIQINPKFKDTLELEEIQKLSKSVNLPVSFMKTATKPTAKKVDIKLTPKFDPNRFIISPASGGVKEYYPMMLVDKETGTKWGLEADYTNADINDRLKNVNEASGYIPSEKEKNDPRFKTALTVDINPYTMKKGAKQFGWNISRAGIPPTAKANGKI